jgi:uncharacterized peroxidase-related enzyme
MAFIKTISDDQADGMLKDLYQAAQKSNGYVPNYVKAFSLHPEVYEAWSKLIGAIRGKMRLRRYELVTISTAMVLSCTYWMLAHGAVLRKNFFSDDELAAIVKDFRNAGLTDEEVAIMAFAQKVATQPAELTEKDFDELRGYGLSDEEILDVVLACTARSFFSRTLDALGAVPDEAYREFKPELLKVLALGRPFQG